MVKSFLNDIVFEKWNILDNPVFLDVFCHGLDCKELIARFVSLGFVVSDSSQRSSQVLIEISFLVVDDVKAIRPLTPVHVAKLFVEIWVGFQDV